MKIQNFSLKKTLSLLISMFFVFNSASAIAKTEIHWWHAMGGANGERVDRIAAGFNEPQSLKLRGEELFVFSRLGVTRLVDRDSDGETDFYEMFSNRFTQSADTRDYPLSLALRPDGSFVISKGGQPLFFNERMFTPI